ncbi:MAG: tetratricopeptide repeat protein [Firmicutes bacterium]|nr:tetratricopeptide repeat protein [Bacillota bacterium]
MDRIEVFQILGIEPTKDEKSIKNAYRERLSVTNPEDDPEGFKRLREAYEEACRLAKESDESEEERRDETASGVWVEKAASLYGNIKSRRDVKAWEALFADDCFLSLEEEENCRVKLLRFIMDHFRLPGDVWKLLDRKLCITTDAAALREKFPADFIRYILAKCERGEDVEFDQFEGEEDAPYDLFLQYYDRCWQALQSDDLEQARQNIENADGLKISHPAMEVCRAELLEKQGRLQEAIALLDKLLEKYPGDAMLCYNAAEMLWRQGQAEEGAFRRRSAKIYESLKEENDGHYMANVRLTEWYYDNRQFKEAKKCAEKVLSAGSGDEFMELLCRVNEEIEEELEEDWRKNKNSASALELCWCYLQDGKIARGIRLALQLEKQLPEEKEAEWNGLMAKLYVEEAEYDASITMTHAWEEALEKKLLADESEEEREKDRDRQKQAHMIRMQCFHNLGFQEEAKFAEAIREGRAVLEGNARDIGILLEMAQIYTEMQEYEKCEETVRSLVEDHQVYAAYAASLEAYRRQLDPGGVIRAGSRCIQYFPTFVKPYEYVAKVYFDLEQPEELKRVFEDAEKNGVKSDVLEAYKYQQAHGMMELDVLNKKLKAFRKHFRKQVEDGKLSFYESGLPVLTEYLYNCPDSYMFVERGIFHRAAHHYKEAREDFEKALALNPSNPYALNGLSFVYKYTGDFEKALFYIKKAILYMDEEMSPVIYTDMANLYSLLGDYEMALAACRQYNEIVKEQSTWFLNQMAEVYINLGRAADACEWYGKCQNGSKWKYYEKSVEAYITCGEEKQARQLLTEWAGELKIKKDGIGRLIGRMKTPQGKGGELGSFYLQAFWAELLFGEKKDLADYMAEAVYYRDSAGGEGTLSDAVFACIVSGMDKLGRKYGEQLRKWLQSEKLSGDDKYFNREKAHLQKEILAAWYTKEEDEIQALLDREQECGLCHFCTSAVCKELESLRILFLIRKGKRKEAEERLLRSLERQPSDEYMLALKHNVFAER